MGIQENKERFISIFNDKVQREGADKLLSYLCSDSCDFFTAPASTRFHGAYEGGLCQHSLNVYDCLVDIMARPRMREMYGVSYPDESLAIAALLHIRYHMGFSTTDDPGNVGKALEMFPLAFGLCCADMEASYFMEGTEKK